MVSHKNPANTNAYLAQSELVKNLIQDTKDTYFSSQVDNLNEHRGSSESFWSIIKNILGKNYNRSIPTIENPDSMRVSYSNQEKADAFLSYFSQMYYSDIMPVPVVVRFSHS